MKAQVNSDIGITQHGKYDGSIGAGEMVAEKNICIFHEVFWRILPNQNIRAPKVIRMGHGKIYMLMWYKRPVIVAQTFVL